MQHRPKNDMIEKAIEKYKYKRGLSYHTPNDALYRRLRLFLLLSFLYFFVFNIFYLLGVWVQLSSASKENYTFVLKDFKPTAIPALISTVFALLGLVFSYFKKLKIFRIPVQPVATVTISAAALVNLITYFKAIKTVHYDLDEHRYVFGIQTFFIWRNFIPCALVMLFGIWMSVLYFRAIKFDHIIYDEVTENLYERYQKGDIKGYTDEEWESFITLYEKAGYKKQFAEKSE